MKLNANEQTCHLQIETQLDAAGVEDLIARLVQVRSTMLPAVPMSLPQKTSVDAMQILVTVEDEPAIGAKLLRDGRPRLMFRSKGLGWLLFDISTTDARLLRDWFAANVQGRSDLLTENDRKRH